MEAVPSLSISNHASKSHAGRYGQLSVHKPMGSLGHFGPWVSRPTTAAATRERQHASLSSIRANSRWCSGPQFASINEPKTHSKVIKAWREGAMTDISDMHESALVGDMVCRFINASSLYSWGSLLQMTLHGPASRPAGGCRHARLSDGLRYSLALRRRWPLQRIRFAQIMVRTRSASVVVRSRFPEPSADVCKRRPACAPPLQHVPNMYIM